MTQPKSPIRSLVTILAAAMLTAIKTRVTGSWWRSRLLERFAQLQQQYIPGIIA